MVRRGLTGRACGEDESWHTFGAEFRIQWGVVNRGVAAGTGIVCVGGVCVMGGCMGVGSTNLLRPFTGGKTIGVCERSCGEYGEAGEWRDGFGE